MKNEALFALGISVAGLLAAMLLAGPVAGPEAPLPPVGPDVEAVCREAMERSAADLTWTAPDRVAKLGGRQVRVVRLGELAFHGGDPVRVAGLLHVELESVGLYPSRAALDEGWHAPWVSLETLWPNEPYWRTKGPAISDRCAVVEGTYAGGPGGRFGWANGTIGDLLRLEVWSAPHRPAANGTVAPPAAATP